MQRKHLIIAGVASAVGALAFVGRKDILLAFDYAKAEAFKFALPSPANQYADAILSVSKAKGVSPLITYGLGDRESGWGRYLQPSGSGGTGDFTPRNWTVDTNGTRGPVGKLYSMPPDGKGWGRGLLQLDWWWYGNWLDTHNWADPYVMISKALDELNKHVRFFAGKTKLSGITDGNTVTISSSAASRIGVSPGQYRDPRPLTGTLLWRAALAAYNGGDAYVLRAIASGKDPDTTTTGGNYSKNLLDRALALGGKIGA